jgi:hypothetical protein
VGRSTAQRWISGHSWWVMYQSSPLFSAETGPLASTQSIHEDREPARRSAVSCSVSSPLLSTRQKCNLPSHSTKNNRIYAKYVLRPWVSWGKKSVPLFPLFPHHQGLRKFNENVAINIQNPLILSDQSRVSTFSRTLQGVGSQPIKSISLAHI